MPPLADWIYQLNRGWLLFHDASNEEEDDDDDADEDENDDDDDDDDNDVDDDENKDDDDIDDDENDDCRLHFPVYVSYCAAQPAMDRRLKQLRCLEQQQQQQ